MFVYNSANKWMSAKFRVAPYSERVLGKTDEISKSGAEYHLLII